MSSSIINIQNYNGIDAPDSCNFNTSSQRLIILPEAVVSREKDGSIVSRYRDDVWNFKAYTAGHKILFNKFKEDKETAKSISYAILLHGPNSNGRMNASWTDTYLRVLYYLTKEASRRDISLKELLEDNQLLTNIAMNTINSKAGILHSCIILLIELGLDVGIHVTADPKREKILLQKSMQQSQQQKQFPIIPPEIYANIYVQRWKHFELLEKNIEGLSLFLRNYTSSPYYGRDALSKIRTVSSKLIPFKEAAQQCKISAYMQNYGIVSGKIESLISKINKTCAGILFQSTGMRFDELTMLTHSCFTQGTLTRPPIISGVTKKGIKGAPKIQEWITHGDISRVIAVLEKIGNAIVHNLNIHLPEELPLFIKPEVALEKAYYQQKVIYNSQLTIRKKISGEEFPLDKSKFIITEKMMHFLNKTHAPGRFKDDKYISIGKTWHFTAHQFRRSFAFYAINSGLVSVNSLSKQLAHGLLSTSAYYSNGAANIQPIIADNSSHISKEIEKQRNENAVLTLVYNVITNKSRIPAPIQEWANKINTEYDSDPNDLQSFIWNNKEQIKKDIKKGHLYYKPTPIGGCITSQPCDAFVTFNFTECGDCKEAFLEESKINSSLQIAELSLLDLLQLGYTEKSKEVKTHQKEIKYFKTQKEKFKGR